MEGKCKPVKWWKFEPDCDCNVQGNSLCREGKALAPNERAIDSTMSCETLSYYDALEKGTIPEEELEEACSLLGPASDDLQDGGKRRLDYQSSCSNGIKSFDLD